MLEYHRDEGRTVVTIPYELEVWAHRKQAVSARFWYAVMEACETLVQPSNKTLDEVQKARVKERMQELKIQQMAPEKELPLPLFEHAGHRDSVDAYVVNHAYPGLHAGTHMLALFKAAVASRTPRTSTSG